MRAIYLAGATALLVSGSAGAQSFPARSGERGILDVPDAEVSGVGGGLLGAELRFDHASGQPDDVGPFPIYAVGGVASNLDVGVTMREWGQPEDPRPAKMLFGAAAKLQLFAPSGRVPGVAVGAILDRFNEVGVLGARVAVSTARLPLRLAAFVGGEAEVNGFDGAGVTGGLAVTLPLARGMDVAGEALTGPRGANLGLALRVAVNQTVGVAIGGNYLPGDDGYRISVAFAFSPPPKPRTEKETPRPAPRVEEEAPEGAVAALEDRPRFRLRMAMASPLDQDRPRRLQHGPYVPDPKAAAGAQPTAAPRSAAPNLEDLAEAQLREQEALADARERRVRTTAEQLDTREKEALSEAARLDERERELTGREQHLDARESRIAPKTTPTQQQRQLESLEAQLASQERNLSAQERSYGPAIDAAGGRERNATAREDAERQEASRLAASVGGAGSRGLQLELRKQALGARNRQLAALEARLVARGERIDALERQLRTRAERLETRSRRLDTRSERLELLERRASEASQPAAAKPSGAEASKKQDKAVFVMVVKSPTTIVKERAAAPAAGPAGAALHPGVAVEKAVAAATVVMFPTPATQLSELDREAIDEIAKLAAREQCELLIWARAKGPSHMAEAQRRTAEIRTRSLAAGPLLEQQVVTRITTRPGAQGVDVVVSALRESAKPAPAPAPAAALGVPSLRSGESGKRQIREAVQTAQASIETCVGELISTRNLARAEGVLKLSVSPRGRVTKASVAEGDLSGTQMEECLDAAAGKWLFPPAEADYVVEVPITVIRGAAK